MNPTAAPTQQTSPIAYSPISNYQDLQNLSTQNQPQQAPQQQGSQPNFLEKLLPTAGGILGGLISAPLELAPGVGTALNIAGAGAGDALGKFLENKLTGQAGGNDVVASGVEGAAGQGVGGLLGSAFGGIASKLGDFAGNTSTKLIQGQAAKGALDTGTAQALNDMGITNLDQVRDIAPHVTGGTGALSNGVKQALGESNSGVDITGLDQIANNTLAEQGASPGAISTVGRNLTNATNNMLPGDVVSATQKGGGSTFSYSPGALQNALPENVFAQTQKMEQLASEASNKAFDKTGAVINADEYAKYKTYQNLAGELKDRTFGGDNPIPLSDENKASITSGLAPVADVNPAAHNFLVNKVQNATNLQDLRPVQAPFVRAGQALNATDRAVDTGGGLSTGSLMKSMAPVAGGMAAGPVGAAAGALPMLAGSKLADKVGASTLSKISDLLTNPTMKTALKEATREGTQVVANAPNDISQPTTGGLMQPGMTGTMPGAQPGQIDPNTYNQILNAMMAQSILAPNMAGNSGATSYLQSVAPQLQKNQLLGSEINALPTSFGNAGGAQGLGGILSHLTGLIPGTSANAFQSQSSALASQLAQALGISPAAAAGLIPELMQSQGTANEKQSVLGSLGASLGGGAMGMAQ